MKAITILFLLISFCLSAISANAAVTLPDSIEAAIDDFDAAGNFAAADSLRRASSAQVRQGARKEAKRLEQWATWNAEVTPMSYDEVWDWCDSSDKTAWLGLRYDVELAATTSFATQLSTLQSAVARRLELRQEVARQVARFDSSNEIEALRATITKLSARVDTNGSNIQANADEVKVLNDRITVNLANIGKALAKLDVDPDSYKQTEKESKPSS